MAGDEQDNLEDREAQIWLGEGTREDTMQILGIVRLPDHFPNWGHWGLSWRWQIPFSSNKIAF